MREAIFYQLYQHFKSEKREDFVPVFQFMGEVWCEPVGKWGFVSFEVSARLSELYSENPGLIERKMLEGKSGSQYYGYRLAPNANANMIKDMKLFEFYQSIKGGMTTAQMIEQGRKNVAAFDAMPSK